MDVAAGFDMVPRLGRGGVDKRSWGLFIECVKEHYKDDQQVVIRPNYIEFNAGEHPKLPFEGHKLLRFSSNISGPTAAATNVESYIDAVTRMAKRSLGSRVLYWNEYFDMDGHYGWDQVHESIRFYNEPDAPKIHPSTPVHVSTTSYNKPDEPEFQPLTQVHVATRSHNEPDEPEIQPLTQVQELIRSYNEPDKPEIHLLTQAHDSTSSYNESDEPEIHPITQVHESIRSYNESRLQPNEPQIQPLVDHAVELDLPLFEVRDIPGKGRGLVARSDIDEGARILCEKPLFTVESTALDRLQLIIAAKLKTLSEEGQQQFLSMHNNHPGWLDLVGIFRTNALPCGAGSPKGGIYTTICLINHRCLPNSHNNWNPEAEHETIHAIRPIQAGEEITIAYDDYLPYAPRQMLLKKSFGFDCECRLCSLNPAARRASDDRRLRIKFLHEVIGNWQRLTLRPEASLKDCHNMLQLLREEFDGYIGTFGGMLYYDAFQICIAHGDEARAGVFAERAYELRRICDGDDVSETQDLKALSENPAGHPSFAVLSRKWKRKKSKVPKGLGTVKFEKWLFRL